ncbi:RDD family protein, partial [Dyella sp.]|uniref:RDD family protein n=1 Tax=Dyella sp. TaxID=1869338 RepID=UPI002ED43982
MQQEVSWYFVDLFGQRQGPISRQQLLDAIASERLRPASLVWREGMAQWQPLSSMMHELQAANPAVPPPILPPARVDTNPFAASPSSFASNEWGAQAQRRVVYGGFARRLLASILDSIILSIFNVIVLAVLGAVFVPSFKQGNAAAGGIIVFAYLGLFVISILYFCLQESSAAQATLGKRALGIKVTDLQGNRIGFGRALGRWFGRILSSLFFCIGYLMVIFTERKQGLHDMMTSTLVVDKWAYTDHPERQQQGTSG